MKIKHSAAKDNKQTFRNKTRPCRFHSQVSVHFKRNYPRHSRLRNTPKHCLKTGQPLRTARIPNSTSDDHQMCQQEVTASTLRACWFEKGYKLSGRHPSKLTLIPFCFRYPFIFAGRFNVCVMSTDFYRKDGCNWIKWWGRRRKRKRLWLDIFW